MSEAAVLMGALLSPLLAFALLMWLTHLEETLPRGVAAAQRKPPPPPILAILEPVPGPGSAVTPLPGPEATVAGAVTGSALPAPELSGELSGGLPGGGSALAV